MAVYRRAAERLAAHPRQVHQGIDRARMEPMGAEIDGVTFELDRHRSAADAVPGLEDRDLKPSRHQPPGGGDAGRAGADDHHVWVGWEIGKGRNGGERHAESGAGQLCGGMVHR
jgi:hypothetical protein